MAKASNRRDDIEKFLADHNVKWVFQENVSTTRFNVEKSLKNQVRLGTPLKMDTVDRYTEDLFNGDRFPPLLVEKDSDGLFLNLDGNHRLRAHMNANMAVDLYECEAPRATLVLISYLANLKHGLPSSEEDRLHHAMFLIDNGMTSSDAATKLGVPRNKLRAMQARVNAARRADDAGILRTDWDRIPDSARRRLADIHTDEGFKAAVSLVRDAALNSAEIARLVAGLNEVRSGVRQKKMVGSVRLEMAERIASISTGGGSNIKGHRNSSPRARLAMACGHVNALPDPAVYSNDLIPEQLRADTLASIESAREKLDQIWKVLM